MGKGRTIHSSAQLKAHGIIVDDCAIANGGQQRIITQGGYVIPLHICSGLAYIDMHPSTSDELKPEKEGGRLHIILTSDLDWAPSSIDYEHDMEVLFDAMQDLPELNYDVAFIK